MSKNWLVIDILRQIRLNEFKRAWRRANKENGTIAMGLFPQEAVSIGKSSYGELNVITFNNRSRLLIGAYCSIAQEVRFLLDVEHELNTLSSFPFDAKLLNGKDEAFSKGDIIVDDDVWIGYGVTILSGVHICQGAVIATGSVVTKDVPPYAIVGGVPAHILRYRFTPPVIDFLLTLDYGKLDEKMIRDHVDELYRTVHDMSVDEVEQLYGWFPKK